MKRIYSIYQMALRTFTPAGTLRAAAEQLPRLAQLGFDFLYLCPVFVADDDPDPVTWSERQRRSGTYNPKNPYKMKDYFHVDPEYGTDDDLRDFVTAAHALGLRVMLDLVYLHCGKNAVFAAEHPEYLVCGADGRPIVGDRWPFARLNYECAGAREYLLENMMHYVTAYGIDGYRCDVGDCVPLDFWREGVRRITAVRPDFVMLNEGWEDESVRGVFDLYYAGYPADIGKDTYAADVKAFADAVHERGVEHHLTNKIENHDIASDSGLLRYEQRNGHDMTDCALFMMYMESGVPFVWNGNEFGDTAENNMFSNRFHGRRSAMDYSCAFTAYGRRRMELLTALNRLRRTESALLTGDTEIMDTPEKTLLLLRRGDRETLIAVLCTEPGGATVKLPAFAEDAVPLLARNASAEGNTACFAGAGFLLLKHTV